MKRIGKFNFIFLLLVSFRSFSQVVVQAEVSSSKVGLSQPFELEVSISTSSQADISKPTPPSLSSLQIIGSSQRTQISTRMQPGQNGMEYVTQKTMQYSYQILPTQLGKQIISSFSVNVDGKEYKTSPIQIEVVKAVSSGSKNQFGQNPRTQKKGQRVSPFDEEEDPFAQMDRIEEEMFNQLLKRRGLTNPFNNQEEEVGPSGAPNKEPEFRSMPKNQDEAFFIQVEADKTEVYEGEQIVVSWYLMTRGQIESLDRTKFPDLKGFWKEIIEEVPAIQFYQEVVNGVPYKKALLARHALFPLKAGETVIDEFKIKSRVRTMDHGFGFNGKSYEYTKSSQRVKIKVKPLPLEGRPINFTGAVGKFQIKSSIEGGDIVAHQPLKMKIRFEGFGNAKGLELPSINWPEGLELFEVKNDAKYLKNGQSYKEFELILIPRKEGPLIIPSIESSFFNPETGKYYTEKTQEIPITVQPGNQGAVADKFRIGDSSKKNHGIEKSQSLPLPIPEIKGYERSESTLGVVWLVVYFLILIFFFLFSIFSFGWFKERKNFRKELLRRIHLLEANWNKRQSKDNYIEVTNLFYFVFGALAGEGGGSMEIAKLIDKVPASLRRKYEKEIMEQFEYFQMLSFAPDHMTSDLEKNTQVKNQFDKVKKLLLNCVDFKNA
ncbi:MAG: BatD family protein [Bdellovibrionaceae bacterium]|nr:BatD family protein [Pseudobdellovibrionaceae bacterium]NUM57788.1 protein BatD [Pseudobdellovibrionaceae bacterium]